MILSIESSCDDSSIALTNLTSCALLYHKKISQDESLSQYGGVVPEIASRLHAINLPRILRSTLEFLNGDLSKIKAIAVTTHPGLSATLIEGLSMAKTLSIALDVPLISVNHLKGHIYSLFINMDSSADRFFPLSALLVSGGHTQILEVNSFEDISLISQTLDDSFGESFDKVAKMLNLGYPGGCVVENLAKNATEKMTFPIPMKNKKSLDFSFSGLKNAVRLAVEKAEEYKYTKQNICLGFQNAAIEHLSDKFKQYLKSKNSPPKYIAIVGGASANLSLRAEFENIAKSVGATLLLTDMAYCSDNAAMIGRVGVEYYKHKLFAPLSVSVTPRINEFATRSIQ